MNGLTRDGTAQPVSRPNYIGRRFVTCVVTCVVAESERKDTSRIGHQPFRLIPNLLNVMTIHNYIHSIHTKIQPYIHTYIHKSPQNYCLQKADNIYLFSEARHCSNMHGTRIRERHSLGREGWTLPTRDHNGSAWGLSKPVPLYSTKAILSNPTPF